MHRKVVMHAWELAHISMHYGLTVYGDAVHEEVAQRADYEWYMTKQTVVSAKTCEINKFSCKIFYVLISTTARHFIFNNSSCHLEKTFR